MSWLRLDDAFAQHPKLLQLERADRWTWLEVLCYCARYRSELVPPTIVEAVPHATPAYLDCCRELGLLEHDEHVDGALRVHDWAFYNPAKGGGKAATAAENEAEPSRAPAGARTRAGARAPARRRARPVPSPETPYGVSEGAGPKLATSQTTPQQAASSAGEGETDDEARPPGRPEPLACPFAYETGPCGVELADEAELAEHLWNVHGVEPPHLPDTAPPPAWQPREVET